MGMCAFVRCAHTPSYLLPAMHKCFPLDEYVEAQAATAVLRLVHTDHVALVEHASLIVYMHIILRSVDACVLSVVYVLHRILLFQCMQYCPV